jgi:hypothetical protein
MSAKAHGEVSVARGDVSNALVALRRAASVWQSLEVPYEVAQVRVLLSSACRALGDDEAAQLELEAARAGFTKLGAGSDLARLAGGAARVPGGLSEREVESAAPHRRRPWEPRDRNHAGHQ